MLVGLNNLLLCRRRTIIISKSKVIPVPDPLKETILGLMKNGTEDYCNQRYFSAIQNFDTADKRILELLPDHSFAPETVAASTLISLSALYKMDPGGFDTNLGLLKKGQQWHDVPNLSEKTTELATRLKERVLDSRITDSRMLATTSDFDPVQLYYYDIPMNLANSLVQAGHNMELAINLYMRIRNSELLNQPVEAPVLYLNMARAYFARGEALYRAENPEVALKSFEVVLVNGDVPVGSPLYTERLAIMRAKVRSLLQTNKATGNPGEAEFTNSNAILAMLRQIEYRTLQIKNKLNYIGYPVDGGYVPTFNFEYLQGVARGFAQFAAQANREYISYTERSEEKRQSIRQLEQSVALSKKAEELEQMRVNETERELDAAEIAQSTTEARIRMANATYNYYVVKGWEIVQLDTAQAWAGSTNQSHDDQMKLWYKNLEDLGIKSGYQPQSVLLQQLAYQRSRRSYEIELRRMRDNIAELNLMLNQSGAQTRVANARQETAKKSLEAARWRTAFSRANLDSAQASEMSPMFYGEMAILARETAQIYLHRAIEAAYLMQAAYNFERGVFVQLIRFDYGDLNVANGLYAADLLLRDIDYFAYDKLISAQSKDQPVRKMYSLRNEFPLQFNELRRTGKMRFQTVLEDIIRDFPGICNARIKQIEIVVQGATGIGGVVGRLTAGGVSKYRDSSGTMRRKVHSSETLFLSQFSPRDNFLSAEVPSSQLRIFENFGMECDWLLEIPQHSNPFSFSSIADIDLYVSFLAQHNAKLADTDIAQLPASEEAEYIYSAAFDDAQSWQSLSATGRLVLKLNANSIPRNHKQARIKDIVVIGMKSDGTPVRLVTGFYSNGVGDATDRYITAANGVLSIESSTAPGKFAGKALPGEYVFSLSQADNPAHAGTPPNELNLSAIYDIQFVFRYKFSYS
jgi:hypothetical protein